MDFNIQGFSYYKLVGREIESGGGAGSLGWYYSKSSDSYYWYDRVSGNPTTSVSASAPGYFPVGGSYNNKVSSCILISDKAYIIIKSSNESLNS